MICILFANRDLQSTCNSYEALKKQYDSFKAERILQRLVQIRSAQNLANFCNEFGSRYWKQLCDSQFLILTNSQSGIVIEAFQPLCETQMVEKIDYAQITQIKVLDLDRRYCV